MWRHASLVGDYPVHAPVSRPNPWSIQGSLVSSPLASTQFVITMEAWLEQSCRPSVFADFFAFAAVKRVSGRSGGSSKQWELASPEQHEHRQPVGPYQQCWPLPEPGRPCSSLQSAFTCGTQPLGRNLHVRVMLPSTEEVLCSVAAAGRALWCDAWFAIAAVYCWTQCTAAFFPVKSWHICHLNVERSGCCGNISIEQNAELSESRAGSGL